jgi:tetratricopeptide (TPR) repeat protein
MSIPTVAVAFFAPISIVAKLDSMPPTITTATQRPLLQAALAALESNALGRADELFKQHLRGARDDLPGLAHYGTFCLQTGQSEAACYFLHKASRLAPGDADLLNQLGYAQLQDSDPESAHQSFDAALTADPVDPLALNGLGLYRMQTGSPSRAMEAFERAAAIEPDNVAILINLADALTKLGDSKAAIAMFERARTIAPQHPATLLEYARCLRTTGSPERAIQMLASLAPQDRNQPQALLEASRSRRQLGQYAQAIALLEMLDRQLPGTGEYHEEMGHCLPSPRDSIRRHAHWTAACTTWIGTQEFSRADSLLEMMLAENPDDASAWNLLGISGEAQHRFEQAETSFVKAIEIDRHCLDAYPNLATLLEEVNRIADARQVADAGLELGSGFVGFSINAYIELRLVSCKIARRQQRFTQGMEQLERLNGLALSAKQQEIAQFERGMLFDRLQQPASAMASFIAANALVRQHWALAHPGPNRFMVEVEDMIGLAARGGLEHWKPIDVDRSRPDPVFLIGFPRSGTTLLNQILDSNSHVRTIEEKPTIARLRNIMLTMPEGYPDAIPACDAIDAEYLRRAYFKAVALHGELDDARVLVDKFPLHIVKVALIHRVFPDARFIFSARHPCDVCLSCFMQNFRPNDAMANFFSLADTVALYIRTMELWQICQEKLPISVHTVRYDSMVDDVESETKNVCDYLGVPWQESQADFAEHALRRGKIHTPSYEQVSQPIYRGALGRWENYREYFEPYLPALQPWIDKYG